MGVNSLPKTVTRQRRDCDLNPGRAAPESSTLTTRLPSHPVDGMEKVNEQVMLNADQLQSVNSCVEWRHGGSGSGSGSGSVLPAPESLASRPDNAPFCALMKIHRPQRAQLSQRDRATRCVLPSQNSSLLFDKQN